MHVLCISLTLIGSYKELHDWSVNYYAEFWEECFLFFDILHCAPYSQVWTFKQFSFVVIARNGCKWLLDNLWVWVIRYGDSADNAVDVVVELQRLLNPNTLVAISKGMRAVKLCTNKILPFLAGDASWHRLTCIMAIKRWFLLLFVCECEWISFFFLATLIPGISGNKMAVCRCCCKFISSGLSPQLFLLAPVLLGISVFHYLVFQLSLLLCLVCAID